MNDLIRREDAIEGVRELFSMGDCYCDELSIVGMLNSLPTAEPEFKQKKGKWIGDFCSCCGLSKYYFFKMVDDECTPYGMWNFCPNCGADMREEDLICGNCGCQLQRTYDGIDINYCPECGYKLEWE